MGLGAPSAQAADVVDTAASVDDLSTLVSLVQAAGLVDALKDAEDITVFAPTNAAFEALPSRVSRAIEINPDILTTILLYHVAPERLRAADVVARTHIDTLANDPLRVRTPGGTVKIDRSTVIATDIETDNATVHLIDRVLLPWNLIREDVREALNEERAEKRAEKKHSTKSETYEKHETKGHTSGWEKANDHTERMHEVRNTAHERMSDMRDRMNEHKQEMRERWSSHGWR